MPRTKSADFSIKPAAPGDLDRIIRLDTQITATPKPEYWRRLFDAVQSMPNEHFFLVATHGPNLLGFIVGEIRAWEFGSPPCGWIFAIAVDPDARLGTIGTALFNAVCDRFRKARVTKVRTMIARDAQLVMSFFRSQGMMAGPFIELEKDLDE